ncbi:MULTISPECIES: hypothetical protein [unclassified Streptomyces]
MPIPARRTTRTARTFRTRTRPRRTPYATPPHPARVTPHHLPDTRVAADA